MVTSWSRVKLIVQMQLGVYPHGSFFIDSHNITANNVEKLCYIVLNVILTSKNVI